MSTTEAMSRWIQTYSSAEPVHPLSLKPQQVRVEDIAHALALKCRWTGHTRTFYSVAEHSLRVGYLVPRYARIYGLLHDAAEAYLPDVAAPLKDAFQVGQRGGLRTFAQVEHEILDAIWTALGVPPPAPATMELVKNADLVLLATEARDLMHGVESWSWTPPQPLQQTITPLTWQQAEQAFLDAIAAELAPSGSTAQELPAPTVSGD